jgi:hypothetical protein
MKRYKRKFEEVALNKKALDGLEDLISVTFLSFQDRDNKNLKELVQSIEDALELYYVNAVENGSDEEDLVNEMNSFCNTIGKMISAIKIEVK